MCREGRDVLTVTVALTLGSKLYDQQAIAFRLRRTQLPALDRLEVLLPAAVEFDASPGDDCSLEIDGGDGAATVFTGVLTQSHRSFDGLRLTAHNGGLQLARFRPAAAFAQMTVGEVIESLCADAGVTVADVVDGPTLALLALDGRSTASDEIARLALVAGAVGAFSGSGELHVTEEGGPAGELALRYGREIIAAESTATLNGLPSIAVVGDGGGGPASPEGRWVIADFSAGAAPSPGVSDRVVAIPDVRTTDDAGTAAAALTQRRSVALSPVRLRLWMNPKIEPGMRLELADMPDSLPLGECRVGQLVTTCVPGGPMITDVWASGQTAGASDLLGSLAGAVGGLL
jgi:hypothetical protein